MGRCGLVGVFDHAPSRTLPSLTVTLTEQSRIELVLAQQDFYQFFAEVPVLRRARFMMPARVSETLRGRLDGLAKAVRDIAWKARIRLCARYRRLSNTGKKLPVVVAAIAREMAAFLWAIGREVAPA